jgi:hypothetical protein
MTSEKEESEIEIQKEDQDPGDRWFHIKKESLILRYRLKASAKEIDYLKEKKVFV